MSKLLKKYRTYFDKNNTITLNSLVNTANNPVAQITNGESCSRYLFFSDFTELKTKYNNGELNLNSCTHKIRLKNTSNYDISQVLEQNTETYDGKLRAYSTNLELHLIDEFWDAGVGYDYYPLINDRPDERNFVKGASNWVYRTSVDQWSTPGALSGGSQALAISHLDNGGEDVEFDVTDIINKIIGGESLSGYTANDYYGFAVKFPEDIEINSSGYTNYLGVFTKYTQSFFEPYIETTQDLYIHDNRRNFYLDKDNYLYFYSIIGGTLKDLDETPTFTIDNGPEYQYTVERVTKGIYRALVPADIALTSMVMYYDIWGNLKYNGKILLDVTLDFVPKPANEYFGLGLMNMRDQLYTVSLTGIKMEEKLKTGEIKTVRALIRKPFTSHVIEDEYTVSYTLYIKQGPNRVTVIDWQKADLLYSGFEFTIDTTWLVPQQYFIDIQVETNNETIIYNEEVKFNVINDFINKTRQ